MKKVKYLELIKIENEKSYKDDIDTNDLKFEPVTNFPKVIKTGTLEEFFKNLIEFK